MSSPALYRASSTLKSSFYVNKDCLTCFLTLLNVVQALARIEVLLNDEIPAREVIQPALRYNPDFFNRVYTDLINCEKNEAVIQEALDAINNYLDERQFIFQPVLDYLAEQKAPRAITELNADLGRVSHNSEGTPEFDEESLESGLPVADMERYYQAGCNADETHSEEPNCSRGTRLLL